MKPESIYYKITFMLSINFVKAFKNWVKKIVRIELSDLLWTVPGGQNDPIGSVRLRFFIYYTESSLNCKSFNRYELVALNTSSPPDLLRKYETFSEISTFKHSFIPCGLTGSAPAYANFFYTVNGSLIAFLVKDRADRQILICDVFI